MRFAEFELGGRVSKQEYAERQVGLRVDLLNLQFDLKASACSVIVVVAGDDREGCEELIDRLHEWLDARYLDMQTFAGHADEEGAYPAFRRYWNALPRHGRIGVFYGAWPFDAVREELAGPKRSKLGRERRLEHVRRFEETLAENGTLLVKLWLHAPRKAIDKALRKRARKKRPGWKAARAERALFARYDEIVAAGERMVAATDAACAPWTIVESTDEEHRDLCAFEELRRRLAARLGAGAPAAAPARVEPAPSSAQAAGEPDFLAHVDLGAALEEAEYQRQLEHLQGQLADLSLAARRTGLATVLVFEGWDAAGKGGAIRRLIGAMAARDYRVVPISAPSEEERAHPWLWRFWRRVPPAGRMAIFDRSWYGRVLVERVEGYARPEEWRRAFAEIAEFEASLAEHGTCVQKFWLHIDPEEQLRRFRERAETPYKKYKLTEDDYRNRDRWQDYAAAMNAVIAHTDGAAAPWHLVAANDKRHARVAVLRAVCAALERRLERR